MCEADYVQSFVGRELRAQFPLPFSKGWNLIVSCWGVEYRVHLGQSMREDIRFTTQFLKGRQWCLGGRRGWEAVQKMTQLLCS